MDKDETGSSSDEESGGLTSETTPLHVNTARNRISSFCGSDAALTPRDVIAPSPTRAGRHSSNLSLISVDSHGNMTSATTPNISNTTFVEDSFGREYINGKNCYDIPPIPSIFSRHAISQLLPRHRQLVKSYHDSQRKSTTTWSNSNRQTSCGSSSNVHSLASRIKISTTLGILVLGLILSICMLVRFATMGPTPYDDSRRDNGIDGNDQINEFNGGTVDSGELHGKQKGSRHAKAKDVFDEEGRYIIEDYDALPTFSNFLPGVAGIYGKPVWSFYVNRGQGISSFGVKSKDFPIMEFQSANNAYQNTQLLGFRTFYQGRRTSGRGGGKSTAFVVEPFDSARTKFSQYYNRGGKDAADSIPINDESANFPLRTMFIGSNELQIREVDHVHMIETNVTYFTLPEESFGAFVRRTTIANIDNDRLLHISILDGLARIQPFGGKLNTLLKTMGRSLEGWMEVHNADHQTMPFFRLSMEPSDSAAVVIEEAGHFCLSFLENEEQALLPIVYDTNKVFGKDTSLMRPIGLYEKTVMDIAEGEQFGSAKTSSAFAAVKEVVIYPGQSITISTFYGRANAVTDVPVIARRITQGGFARYKLSRARELIKHITADVKTDTADKLFDAHVEQMYLDNSLRGGVPVFLGAIDDKSQSLSVDEDSRIKVYHLFSRIHGDLERDYNDFFIEPTFFSEGPGNFRDVAQNRRNDVIINPRIGSFDVKLFLTFIQADGYNPLSVEAVVFKIEDEAECNLLAAVAVGYADGHRADREALASILCDGPFRPGQLVEMIEEQNIFIMTNLPELIDNVAASATIHPMAVSNDRYSADHWTYYMDLLKSYTHIYPDREEQLLYDEELPYYFSSHVVRPRAQKYVLSMSYDGARYHVRQLNPTFDDPLRRDQMRHFINNSSGWFDVEASYHHDSHGRLLKNAPIAKLFLLSTLKFATRDAYGMGIEYEGGRPGWNEAMNGIVSMLGSGMPETYELKLLLQYLRQAALKYKRPIVVPVELALLIDKISTALDDLGHDKYMPQTSMSSDSIEVPSALFNYWDTVANAREEYRNKSFSGKTKEYAANDVVKILDRWATQIELGIARAHAIGSHGYESQDETLGITPTYFYYTVTKWIETSETDEEGHPFVNATELTVGKFPLFLEGVVRMLKTVDTEKATSIYHAVKNSGLRDKKLGMYTLSSSLVGQSFDMGRMMAFSPGWLENQSVWLHMSYKYYLELLRKGMYNEFFTEMRTGMVPYIDGDKYGRPVLECSSFIVSSAFVDPTMVGQGFLARLTGSTAEFMSMWVLMMIGPTPFFINEENGLLEMQLVPALPHWLFRYDPFVAAGEQYTVRFKLFASIDVIYYTSLSRDVFGVAPGKYEIGLRDGTKIEVDGPTIPTDLALKIRQVVFVDYIHAYL